MTIIKDRKIMKMKVYTQQIFFTLLAVVALAFMGCNTNEESNYSKIEPAHIDHIDGSELSKLTLTEKAVERLGIETASVASEGDAKSRLVVPYASILYDVHGKTWVYTNPNPLVFKRHEINVDDIVGTDVYATTGPPVGTKIVIQGAAELLGTEFHVGH